MLAYGFRPLEPLLRPIRIRRRGRRSYEPKDILLSEGYVAEVVASGFTTPVHCAFGPDGRCYAVECGYKTETPPRILEVDVETGDVPTFFQLPQERWFQTGALTGAAGTTAGSTSAIPIGSCA